MGELLWAGIQLLRDQTPGSEVGQKNESLGGRQSIQTSTALIRDAFANQGTWTPKQLRQRFGITQHQTKAALRRLVADGYLIVSGKTRGAEYTLSNEGTASEENQRLSA